MATKMKTRTFSVYLPTAWMITWMGMEPWAVPGDWRSIMAIISGKRSRAFVEDIMWLLDVRAHQSGTGMAYYANRRRKYGLPYRGGTGIWMGSNGHLYARLVNELRVITDGKNETITWTAPDLWGSRPETYQLTLFERGQPRSVTRNVDENIGGEPYHRWIWREIKK